MRNNRPLYWGQGQFLTPQHFQQLDLYHQTERRHLWRAGRAHRWGVRELRLREDALAVGSLEVVSVEIVTREGVPVRAGTEVTGTNARIEPRSFQGLIDPTGAPLSAYLALPRYRPGEANLSDGAPGAGANAGRPPRYRLDPRPVPDLFADDPTPDEVGFLDYNLAVVFDREEAFDQADQIYELVKVAELAPAPGGTGAVLVDDYIPPCLTVAAAPSLYRLLQGLRDLMTAKGYEFAALKSRLGLRATASGGADLLRMLTLLTLNRYIPPLHHHLEVGDVHPQDAYGLLRQIIGELSTFSEEVTVLGEEAGPAGAVRRLPGYRHDDLRACFRPAADLLRHLVLGLLQSPETGIRLEYDGQYFAAGLPAELFAAERGRYYLMIQSNVPGPNLSALLQRTGKISSREDMPQLRQSALVGLPIQYQPVPPPEVPQRDARSSYFAIDTGSLHWRRIRDAGNIAVFSTLRPDDTSLTLLVVRDER
ncbi:MAG TPA: type VI secretion system baseplate subunit TssK [Geminicoccaceae bacterium]|nr:type VI secretion system baseplate subunit TssK [Geminicoccaceae bacterium]